MKKFLFFLLIVGIGLTFWLYRGYSAALKYSLDPNSTDRVSVSIPEGSSGKAIATILNEKGLIKSAWAFGFYTKQKELAESLKAGHYVFQKKQTLPEIASMLAEGETSENSVTLLEGWTAKQMAEALEEEGLTTVDDFMDCLENCDFDFNFIPKDYLEGYLYPDTYFVDPKTYSDEAFISQLIGNLKKKLSDEDWDAINNSDRSFEDIMIMASIVEREERKPDEKATVAGILWNREDNGIGLGADATVLYALGRTKGGLSYDDLQVDSPYNTRKYAGLPPTPICNPSIESIRAALYPEDTDYMYYLHDDEGGIHYAKTLDGHNENKAKYLY